MRYKVGPRYGGGWWESREFDSRSEAVRFRDEMGRKGRDPELIEPPTQEHYDPHMERAMQTVERHVDRLFSGGSNLHLF